MRNAANFYTLYFIAYFPTCIAYNDLPGWNTIDEYMTGLLLLYTLMMMGSRAINRKPIREMMQFWVILMLFTVYGLTFGRNPDGVWLDFIQEMRPYTIIYCTWILNPQFTEKQKMLMRYGLVATLVSWIFYHPVVMETEQHHEFPILGQLAVCAGIGWYLLSEHDKKNQHIATALMLAGMLAPKFKFLGEVVCFLAMMYLVKKPLNFRSPRTAVSLGLLVTAVIAATWSKFDAYYVSGLDTRMARPETFKTAWKILWDYFPFGSGMGSFACNGAWRHYSPLYYEYNLNTIWGLDPGGGFICDAYYPTLAQFGVVGIFFFVAFWKRRLIAINCIRDMCSYRVAWMAFFCLALEQAADSSFLSGKGMGYCMFFALCLNANRNDGYTDKGIPLFDEDDEDEDDEEEEDEEDDEEELETERRMMA